MVLKYSSARIVAPLSSRSNLRRFAVVGAALCGLSFSGCDETPEEGPNPPGADTSIAVDTTTPPADTSTPIVGIDPALFEFGVPGGKRVAFGAVYEPMTAQGLKPYSYFADPVSLINRDSKPMTIVKVELIPLGNTLPSEWTLRETNLEESPLKVYEPFEIPPNSAASIMMRYFPQQTQVSQARLVVTDDKGDKAEMIISGRCRDYAIISPDVDLDWSFNWGHANSSSKLSTGGLATDSAGNSYISGNATQWGDNFNHNIVVAAFNAQGGVNWAKEWNEPFAQEQQDDGQNGATGGGMSCIADGGDGHVYVAGRRSTTQTNNSWQALILKVRAGDGGLAWSKGFVPEAEADVGAEAYAVDATICIGPA